MAEQRENKRCSACGGEAAYVQGVDLTGKKFFVDDITYADLYRCPECGHFDLYESALDWESRERAEERQKELAGLPDYRCPQCGRVGKEKLCPVCYMNCVIVTPPRPKEAKAPEKAELEKPKKRRWFGRNQDKPDWEG